MITSGYFNSSQGDRKYTAEQMSEIFDFLLNDGVLETYGEKLFVTPATSGLGVILGSGWAWFDQTWTKNDSSIPLMLDEPDPSLSRIDTVCLVVNKSQLTRANTFQVFKGLPSLSPQPATLQNTNTIIAHPLAYVTVPADASAISATNIEILVGKTICPFITSILQTTDITTLFQGWTEQYNLAYSAWNTNFNTSLAAWEADFQAWFTQLQTYLSADVVTNLQLQIDNLKTADTNNMAMLRSEIATKVNTSDKATTTNAQAGTDDTKWMTPSKTSDFFNYRKASNSEVASGSNVTKFVIPAQVQTISEKNSILLSMSKDDSISNWRKMILKYCPYANVSGGYGKTINSSNLIGSIESTSAGTPPTIRYTTNATTNSITEIRAASNVSVSGNGHNPCAVSNDLNYYASVPYGTGNGAVFNKSGTRIATIGSPQMLANNAYGFKAAVFTANTLFLGWKVESATSILIYYIPSPYTASAAQTFSITVSGISLSTNVANVNVAGCSGTLNTVAFPVMLSNSTYRLILVNMSSKSFVSSIQISNILPYAMTGNLSQLGIAPCSGGAFVYGVSDNNRTGYGKPILKFTNSSFNSVKTYTNNQQWVFYSGYGLIQSGPNGLSASPSDNIFVYDAGADTLQTVTPSTYSLGGAGGYYPVLSTSKTNIILVQEVIPNQGSGANLRVSVYQNNSLIYMSYYDFPISSSMVQYPDFDNLMYKDGNLIIGNRYSESSYFHKIAMDLG